MDESFGDCTASLTMRGNMMDKQWTAWLQPTYLRRYSGAKRRRCVCWTEKEAHDMSGQQTIQAAWQTPLSPTYPIQS